jgi:hypothetical protein
MIGFYFLTYYLELEIRLFWVCWCYFNNFNICIFSYHFKCFNCVKFCVINLFVTNLNYLKNNLQNKIWGYWKILNLFIICINTFWFIYVFLGLNTMFKLTFIVWWSNFSFWNIHLVGFYHLHFTWKTICDFVLLMCGNVPNKIVVFAKQVKLEWVCIMFKLMSS